MNEIGPLSTGLFRIVAMFPFDTRVVIRLPERQQTHELNRLCDIMNSAALSLKWGGPLRFKPDTTMFPSQFASRWSVLSADVSETWCTQLFQDARVTLHRATFIRPTMPIRAKLFVFDGGIAVLWIDMELNATPSSDFPEIIRANLDATARYRNEDFLDFCKTSLEAFGEGVNTVAKTTAESFVERTRHPTATAEEPHPTLLTRIECKSDVTPRDLHLRTMDLRFIMYLDQVELKNALPSFSDDYVAVGYDSVWWLYREATKDRIPPEVFAYSLAISMRIYELNVETDRQLKDLRDEMETLKPAEGRRHARRHPTANLNDKVWAIRRLRGEIEDILKQFSPLEAFSVWLPEMFLFRTILRNWLIEDGVAALRRKVDTANELLLEIQNERIQEEQRRFAVLAAIFAVASVAGVFLAAVTLGFTQIQWEQRSTIQQFGGLATKLALGLIIILLTPISLSLLFPRWRKWLFAAIPELSFIHSSDEKETPSRP